MNRKNETPATRKRRYNICHRLRARGYLVDVDNHRISLTKTQYECKDRTTAKYLLALENEYHYNLQLRIPGTEPSSMVVAKFQDTGQEALKFTRRSE